MLSAMSNEAFAKYVQEGFEPAADYIPIEERKTRAKWRAVHTALFHEQFYHGKLTHLTIQKAHKDGFFEKLNISRQEVCELLLYIPTQTDLDTPTTEEFLDIVRGLSSMGTPI